jgi:hypothetical protein
MAHECLAGVELVSDRNLALDRVDVPIATVFLSTLVSRGGLQGIESHDGEPS